MLRLLRNSSNCKLCYSLCHKNSNFTKQIALKLASSNFKRSRRPHIEIVYEMILAYENLEVTCTENKALQTFFNRFTKWQEFLSFLIQRVYLKSSS